MSRWRAVALVALVSCAAEDELPAPASYTLGDGTVVDVGADGTVRLSARDHPLIAIDGRGPVSATFELGWQELFGM